MARPRSHSNTESTAANHGGIALMFDHSLWVRRVDLPLFATFESVCAYVQRPCFNAYVICIYRPGSHAPTDAFFTDLSELFERIAVFSSPAIVLGDCNVHLDVATNGNAVKFLSVIESFGFQQHVKTPTHRCGHLLDLILTRPELCINVLPVDPPTLSDHSFVVRRSTSDDSASTSCDNSSCS